MTPEDLILALAQELRELADDAAESGHDISGPEDILAEVDRFFLPSSL